MPVIDLKPAATRLSELIVAVPDSALRNPTPCTEYTVGDVLDHINGLTIAFGGAAQKTGGEAATMGPAGNAANLPSDWRTSLPHKLAELAEKGGDPDAWTGMTPGGGEEGPGGGVGGICFGELSGHGWGLSQGR